MKDTLANKVASFSVALAVADKDEFTPVWQNQPPLAFGETLTAVRPRVTALKSKGAEQTAPTSGSTKQLRDLRTAFETQLHAIARAVYQCLSATGQSGDAEKANVTPSELRNARAIILAGIGETVLDLAEPLLTGAPAPAAKYFTQAQFDTADDLWQQFSAAVGAPAGARSKRKALTSQLPGDVRAIEAEFAKCDDFMPQFALAGEMGRQFSDAWFAARQVLDLGRRAAKPNPPASPAAPSALPIT